MYTYGLQEFHFGLQEKNLSRVAHCWVVQGGELYLTLQDRSRTQLVHGSKSEFCRHQNYFEFYIVGVVQMIEESYT